MSATRFNNDTIRLQKRVQESVGLIDYQLNAPGPGLSMPFMEDPQMRLQRWGANLRDNTANLESDLLGINRKLTKKTVLYAANTPATATQNYGSQSAFIDETRASNPAWTLRDLEGARWFEEDRIKLPGISACVAHTGVPLDEPFHNTESTRLLQKWGTYNPPLLKSGNIAWSTK